MDYIAGMDFATENYSRSILVGVGSPQEIFPKIEDPKLDVVFFYKHIPFREKKDLSFWSKEDAIESLRGGFEAGIISLY